MKQVLWSTTVTILYIIMQPALGTFKKKQLHQQGIKHARPFQAPPASVAWACRKLDFNSLTINVYSPIDPVQTKQE